MALVSYAGAIAPLLKRLTAISVPARPAARPYPSPARAVACSAPSPHLLSLADLPVGESAVVVEVLFDSVRAACAPLLDRREQPVRCAGRTEHAIDLRTACGRHMEIDTFCACFIAVVRCSDGLPGDPRRAGATTPDVAGEITGATHDGPG